MARVRRVKRSQFGYCVLLCPISVKPGVTRYAGLISANGVPIAFIVVEI